MKTLTFILALFLSTFTNAQYSKKDAYISASIIVTSFAINEFNGPNMTKNQIAFTAMSGMAISAGYSLYKTTRLGKKIQRRIKRK